MAFLRSRRSQSLVFLVVALLLTLTACTNNSTNTSSTGSITKNNSSVNSVNSNGNVNNTSKNTSVNSSSNGNGTHTTNTTNSSSGKSNAGSSNTPLTIVVEGKQDTESQLLTKMYVLLLRHAGFKADERVSIGAGDAVFNAMISGHIDISPAFTATGLSKLGLNSTGIAQLDYLQMKQGYEAKYHVTWLDPTPLNAKIYNSAPIVRDSILKKAPQIATVLNKLAPILTMQANQQLQTEVVKGGKGVTVVATQFLQSKGLL